MKYIWLGIKDYLRDIRHDRMVAYIEDNYYQFVCEDIGDEKFEFVRAPYWKEGNLWHYIQQRKIARKQKNNGGNK